MGSSDKLQCVIDLLSKTISSGNIPFADEINALTSELKIVVSIMLVVYTPPCPAVLVLHQCSLVNCVAESCSLSQV